MQSATDAKKKMAKEFEQSRTPSDDLVDLLSKYHVSHLAVACGMAGVLTVEALRAHELPELLQSLQRPTVKGSKFIFSPFERRSLLAAGVQAPGSAAEPVRPIARPASRPCSAGGSDVDDAGRLCCAIP